MIKTKCIYAAIDPEHDGTRISVMSRHTLDDGITPNPQITPDRYDMHIPELAPPLKLVGAYKRGEITWKTFEEGYLFYLRNGGARHLGEVVRMAEDGIVTLLCVEETPEHCHRRLLAHECLAYDPDLPLILD